jgi:hypothetical protein
MGMGMGMGKGKGKSQENPMGRGTGDRIADGAAKDEKGATGDTRGSSSLLNLPPRQRELIRQALTEKLPPEYAAMIQQYFVNIARGKPAATPAPKK